jgi:hypothetical protein
MDDDNNTPLSLNILNDDPRYNFSNSLYNSDFFNVSQHNNIDIVDDSPYSNLQIKCTYLDETAYTHAFANSKKLSFLSLNIQSLASKYLEFSEMIDLFNNANCSPDFILLQEVWQPHCPSLFPLVNYCQPDFKLRSHNVQGGGVDVYIKKDFRYNVLHEKSIFIDRVLESIFVEVWISSHKKIIVGSVYRPNVNHPTLSSSQQFDQFFELFTNLMDDLTSLDVPIFIFGDFNLDLLKYNIIKQVT